MTHKLEGYLSKRTNLDNYPFAIEPSVRKPEIVIVIPALAEADNLPNTLDSLAQCNPALLDKTLVLIVVNNRTTEYIELEIVENNQRTIEWLNAASFPHMHLSYIDASSSGKELKAKEGVGAARKIGMDRALATLYDSDHESPLIVCLDADTLVEPNYLDAVHRYAQRNDAWAGVIDYAHPLPNHEREQAAIVSYELFLRYQHLALRWAKSPYAFHTIGSTIVCTPEAYAAVSGMNKRAAGEDFYFLQQLSKTGAIGFIHDTTVYPSARISWRVPFGTGKRVGRFMAETHEEYRVYACASYGILKQWLFTVEKQLDATAESLLASAKAIHPELNIYLNSQNFTEQWPKLQGQSSTSEKLRAQFHSWFDGFKTLKLIHHLRDNAYPDQPTFTAYSELSKAYDQVDFPLIERGTDSNLSSQIDYLQHLRQVMHEMNG